MSKPRLRIGLIGSGFMGKAHAFGYAMAARVFDLPFEPELRTLADVTRRSRRQSRGGARLRPLDHGLARDGR